MGNRRRNSHRWHCHRSLHPRTPILSGQSEAHLQTESKQYQQPKIDVANLHLKLMA
jgi:hypothetical protein